MSTTKLASIRYLALDRCFRNTGRRYFMEDLINECNYSIYEYSGKEDGVKRRQIFEDISYMESSQGWSIELVREKDLRKTFYYYKDPNFSINHQPLNPVEAEQLNEAINMLNRFKGMPQFEWMEELLTRLETSYKLKGLNSTVVDFEQNPYLEGLSNFTRLFNAIINKQVLTITYKAFDKAPKIYTIHPYYLKQYNNRWFLFGLNPEYEQLSNLALDRIEKIKDLSTSYIENKEIDFNEYFEDTVGVTIPQNKSPEKIILKVESSLVGYVKSKPLHGSQKIKEGDPFAILELNLIINYELETLLFSMADRISILEPTSLKESIKQRAQKAIENNF